MWLCCYLWHLEAKELDLEAKDLETRVYLS
jgi:hypothetical protein